MGITYEWTAATSAEPSIENVSDPDSDVFDADTYNEPANADDTGPSDPNALAIVIGGSSGGAHVLPGTPAELAAFVANLADLVGHHCAADAGAALLGRLAALWYRATGGKGSRLCQPQTFSDYTTLHAILCHAIDTGPVEPGPEPGTATVTDVAGRRWHMSTTADAVRVDAATMPGETEPRPVVYGGRYVRLPAPAAARLAERLTTDPAPDHP